MGLNSVARVRKTAGFGKRDLKLKHNLKTRKSLCFNLSYYFTLFIQLFTFFYLYIKYNSFI